MYWENIYYYNVGMLNFKINDLNLSLGDLVIWRLSIVLWKNKFNDYFVFLKMFNMEDICFEIDIKRLLISLFSV